MPRVLILTALVVCSITVFAQQSPTSGQTFTWSPRGKHFYDAPRLQGASVQALLETALVEALEKRNLRLSPPDVQADLELSYVAALEGDATADQIAAFWRSDPAIAVLDARSTESTGFEHGTLFVKLVDRRTRQKVWSNTVRGLVPLDIPEQERKQRVTEVVEAVMSTYPN